MPTHKVKFSTAMNRALIVCLGLLSAYSLKAEDLKALQPIPLHLINQMRSVSNSAASDAGRNEFVQVRTELSLLELKKSKTADPVQQKELEHRILALRQKAEKLKVAIGYKAPMGRASFQGVNPEAETLNTNELEVMRNEQRNRLLQRQQLEESHRGTRSLPGCASDFCQ